MVIKNGHVYCHDGIFAELDVFVNDDTIVRMERPGEVQNEEIIDAADCYVLPGFVDIHSHGAMSYDFCDADPNGIGTMLDYYGKNGVTSVVPATMSYPKDVLASILGAAVPFFDKEGCGAVLRGVNMEGPFLCKEKCGAQNPAFLYEPNIAIFNELYELCNGKILLVDIAPELNGSLEFVRQIKTKCKISMAHTSADYQQAAAAFQAGASHVTHMFNGMMPFGHREPGVIGAASDFASFIEIISDGIHLHPSVVRSAFRWFGGHRVCLISDSMRATGMPNGEYDLGGQMVHVEDGEARLAGSSHSIAGSVVNLPDMCRRAISFDVPMEQAVQAATLNPAKAVGLDGIVGSIQPGKRADIVVWDKALRTKAVFCGGRLIV